MPAVNQKQLSHFNDFISLQPAKLEHRLTIG